METKKCTTCKTEYPLTDYRKDASRHNGIHPTCNSCNKEIQRRWYNNNKEKARKTAVSYYHDKKDIISSRRKQDRIDNPEKYKHKSKRPYNKIKGRVSSWKNAGIKDMTYEKYLIMLESQNESCAICGKHKDLFKRNLDVDHNHETGIARGLLCTPCNSGIGKLQDSIDMLEKAINYLKNYE
jgi:hypothetical protein|tara:strand:+ start:97 stop:642 length:546 start_codon:yes stop_codon:yes gene_type:complete